MSEKSLNKIKCFEKLSFASILPHITSQNCSTFDSFDDFWPFSAKKVWNLYIFCNMESSELYWIQSFYLINTIKVSNFNLWLQFLKDLNFVKIGQNLECFHSNESRIAKTHWWLVFCSSPWKRSKEMLLSKYDLLKPKFSFNYKVSNILFKSCQF